MVKLCSTALTYNSLLTNFFCSLFGWGYLLWFYYDCRTPERGSRPNPNIRKWRLYRLIQSYFPITLIKTADLSPENNYLIG